MLQKRVRKASLTEAAKPASQRAREASVVKKTPATVTALPIKPAVPKPDLPSPNLATQVEVKPDAPLSITEPSRSLLMQAVTHAESEPVAPPLGPLERLRFERAQKQPAPEPLTAPVSEPKLPSATEKTRADSLTDKTVTLKPTPDPEPVKQTSDMNRPVKPETFQMPPLRHKVTDEELEILNGAKTRIEWRLFWLSLGIALGACLGAIPALLRFQSDKVLTLEGFFQNVLFFAFGLLTVVLGVILWVKRADMKRAYADIKARS